MARNSRGERKTTDAAVMAAPKSVTDIAEASKKAPTPARGGRAGKSPPRQEVTRKSDAGDKVIQRIHKVLRTVLAKQYPEAIIHSVLVEPDEDADGDKIWSITVVVSSPMRTIKVDSMLHFGGHLRDGLEAIGVNEFPVVRYMSLSDAKKLKLESV